MDFPQYDECPLCQAQVIDGHCERCDYKEPTVEEMLEAHREVMAQPLKVCIEVLEEQVKAQHELTLDMHSRQMRALERLDALESQVNRPANQLQETMSDLNTLNNKLDAMWTQLNALESALLKRPDPRVRALYLIAKAAVEDPTGANLEELTFALTKFERDAPELIGGETWDEVLFQLEAEGIRKWWEQAEGEGEMPEPLKKRVEGS